MRGLITATALCLVLCNATAGAAPAEEPGQVVITGIKNPYMHSYRAVMAGLDAFDEYHHLAPLAPEVQFRLQPSKKSAGPGEALTLRIIGDDDSAPIPLAIGADGVFVVPRIQAAYDSKADLVFNQKKGKFRAKAEVRTPGLPDGVLRLGDMRLECKVRIAIGKYEAPFWIIALADSFFLTSDWCGHDKISWPIATASKPAGATLVYGDRRVEMTLKGSAYLAPIGDKGWPDDTLIELRFAE